MEELQSILLDLQLKLNSIVNRIPEGEFAEARLMSSGRALSMSKSPVETQSTETELPGEGPNGCSEQYHTPVLVSFHKWARIILTLYIDKVCDTSTEMGSRYTLTETHRLFVSPTNLSSKMLAAGYGQQRVRGEKIEQWLYRHF